MLSTHLMIGEITRPQGIRGEVKVRPATTDPNRFYDLDCVFLKRGEDYVERKERPAGGNGGHGNGHGNGGRNFHGNNRGNNRGGHGGKDR